ncbi:EpsG family protein [Globicatella sp. PHS-GS-PNBC-21-1553]|uniref:EpsG family protein n=1 Tax=Globicatella sp. PHS-GS-PNBC-21-1553 TaxID=2885764 RepID=UPI00298F2E97|nr:EpsG family protein [Globicatella sp. PHS-GS-PNBC-21-1553]WPC09060.1 EpsG family protein [Globicatella sp. PHS-GS-PNBC-21-1553]
MKLYPFRIILTFILMIIIYVYFAGNTYNADYNFYKLVYNSITIYGNGSSLYNRFEPGFMLIYRLLAFFHLEYQQVISIICIFGLALMFYTVKKFTNNILPFFVLYSIYPLFLDIVQVRNFLSMCILFFGLNFYISEKKSKYLWSLFFVIIATTIHYSEIFYIFIPFLLMIPVNKLEKNFPVILGIGFFSYPIVYYIMSKFLNNTVYYSYIIQNNVTIENASFILFTVFSQIIFSKIFFERVTSRYPIGSKQIILSEFSYKLSIIMVLLIPLFLMNINFTRLSRNTLIYSYLSYCIGSKPYIYSLNKKNMFSTILLFSLVFLYFYFNIYYLNFEGVYDSIINNNYFFN